ncbi:hypothetical protein KIP88_03915 [Bradyrhizobium sp. SRL28]|uniref:hypothetical protein n=1 Tax=Bradyrhizobium sp. SRL28 TaxID=2836178 RepID=UPI001BDF3F58|nr:hypothetical protein [Bradyrhizobium sp. SRL28]MBT1509638.1 hypothetical protein [Bradyrhizobium sp. SRL28]
MACVLHARLREIFADRMRSVGKWPLDESGKHLVNEDDEEISAQVSLSHLCVHSGASCRNVEEICETEVSPSLRAKRSNPSHGIMDGWIASSLALLAMTAFTRAPKRECPGQARA